MRSLNATIFTEIALSLVAINNAPTWVKALWIEQELEARGLWRDDVFDLIRPFLVTGKIRPPEEKNQPAPAPKPLLKPAGPRPEFVVSRPVQTVEEAKWAPSFDDETDEDDSVDEVIPNRSGASSERDLPLPVTGYQADQTGSDGVKSAEPLPIDDYDAESELWEPERESALHYAELTTEQAELASMMHLLAVSTRLEAESDEIESQVTDDVEPTEDERSYVIDEVSISIEPADTGPGDGMVPTPPLPEQERLADSTEVERTEAVSADEPFHQGIANEWASAPEIEVETRVESVELVPENVPDEVVTASKEPPAEPELDLVAEVDHSPVAPSREAAPEIVSNAAVSAAPELPAEPALDLLAEVDHSPLAQSNEPVSEIVSDVAVSEAHELPAEPELDFVAEAEHPVLAPLPEPGPNEGVPAVQEKPSEPELVIVAATELVLSEPSPELVTDESGSANQEPMEPGQESNLTPTPNKTGSDDDIAAWANAWQETVAVPESEPEPDSVVTSLNPNTQIEPVQGGLATDVARNEGPTTTELPADQSGLGTGPSEPTVSVAPEPKKANQERSKSSKPRKRVSTVSSRVTERRDKKKQPVYEVKRAATQPGGETRPTETAVPAARPTNSKSDDDQVIRPTELATPAAKKAPKKISKPASKKRLSLVPGEPLSETTTQLTDPPTSAPAQIAEEKAAFASPAKITSPKMKSPAKAPRKKVGETAVVVSAKPENIESNTAISVQAIAETSSQSTEKRSLPSKAKKAVKTALARSLRRPTQSSEPNVGPTPPSDAGIRSESQSPVIAKEAAKPTPENAVPVRKRLSDPRGPNVAVQTNHGGKAGSKASGPTATATSRSAAVSKTKTAVSLTGVTAVNDESKKTAMPKSKPVVKKRAATATRATAVRADAKKKSSTESVDVNDTQVSPKKSAPRAVAKKKTAPVAQRSSKRVAARPTKPFSVQADADKSALKEAREQEKMHLADAAAIADLYGLHIDTASASDRARLLFFASSLKTSDGDWIGSETQLKTALKAAERSKHPELWKQVIEQSMKIHRKLGRPAA